MNLPLFQVAIFTLIVLASSQNFTSCTNFDIRCTLCTSTSCLTCQAGYIVQPITNQCFQCNVPNCIGCSSPNFCSQCAPGFSSNDFGGNCVTCNLLNCLHCNGFNNCNLCSAPYTAYSGACILCNISNCTLCQTSNICKICQSGNLTNNGTLCLICNVQ